MCLPLFRCKKISVPEFLRSARSSFLLFPIKKENRQRLYNLLSIFILKLILRGHFVGVLNMFVSFDPKSAYPCTVTFLPFGQDKFLDFFRKNSILNIYLQIWFIGRTLASQAGETGSIPAICLRRTRKYWKNKAVFPGFFIKLKIKTDNEGGHRIWTTLW